MVKPTDKKKSKPAKASVKNVAKGRIYIVATFNNTLATFTRTFMNTCILSCII